MAVRELQSGDAYLTRILGVGGFFVTLGQWVIGDLSRYTHAGIYLGNGFVAEAMPGGVQINPISKYYGQEFIHAQIDLTNSQREAIVSDAIALEGTPYSYLGYLYLGLSHFKHCPKWVCRRVSSSNALICSQLVDFVYTKNGVHLFTDGRKHLDTTPGDLARLPIWPIA